MKHLTTQTAKATDEMLDSVSGLAREAAHLDAEVNGFIVRVRAG